MPPNQNRNAMKKTPLPVVLEVLTAQKNRRKERL